MAKTLSPKKDSTNLKDEKVPRVVERPANLHKHHQLVPDPPQVITSDASAAGWGAHYKGLLAQGRWRHRQREVSNVIELRAALCALKAFHTQIQGTSVVVQMDNRTAVMYVRRPGGTRSRSLLAEVTPIMEWAQQHLAHLSAAYIPAPQNFIADTLSRRTLDPNEWSLNESVFHWICRHLGYPDLDLMATTANTKCRRFLSRARFQEVEATDALNTRWVCRLAYVFPLIALIFRLLNRIKTHSGMVIAIIPMWSRRLWFPLLQSLAVEPPVPLLNIPNLLQQGQVVHADPGVLHLAAWRLKGKG